MKRGRPIRTRKPWDTRNQHQATDSAARRAADGPHPLEQAKYEIVARSGGMCEARTEWCQPGPHRGFHAHHVQMRSQGVNHSPENLLWVCADAHSWIHAHTKESYANGWLAHPDRTIEQPGGSYMKQKVYDAAEDDWPGGLGANGALDG